MNILLRILALLKDFLLKPDFSARGRLYLGAISSLGKDASPNDIAPDEYGCAETVNDIHRKVFGSPIGGDVSTYRMYQALMKHPRFLGVDTPLEGDVIISPTGYGNGGLTNGHVGIVGKGGIVMSNDSGTGLFSENFTLNSWRKRYVGKGGYPVKFFRRV